MLVTTRSSPEQPVDFSRDPPSTNPDDLAAAPFNTPTAIGFDSYIQVADATRSRLLLSAAGDFVDIKKIGCEYHSRNTDFTPQRSGIWLN
jgi:hypothetical protein